MSNTGSLDSLVHEVIMSAASKIADRAIAGEEESIANAVRPIIRAFVEKGAREELSNYRLQSIVCGVAAKLLDDDAELRAIIQEEFVKARAKLPELIADIVRKKADEVAKEALADVKYRRPPT